jgi:hypothetical protein
VNKISNVYKGALKMGNGLDTLSYSAAQLLSLGLHSTTTVLNEAKSKHDEGINSIFSQLMPYRVSLASLLTV